VTRSKTRGVLARAVPQTSGAKNASRERDRLCLVIASEAKQSSAAVPSPGLLRRFAPRNDESKTWRIDMPTKNSRKGEKPTAKDFQKRRTYEEGRALMDAAHLAVQRLYCDALGFWHRCKSKPCRRHRRCCGNQTACLLRGLPFVPPAQRVKAEKAVIAGGPRRAPPASHAEWVVRRSALRNLVSWGFG
jgi:hypothetical protein